MRFHQTLIARNWKANVYMASKYQQNFTRHSTTSAKKMTPATTYEHLPSVIEPMHSPAKTKPLIPIHSTPDEIVTPAPSITKEPILLLEGDNYRFSDNGIARSLYQLVHESKKDRNSTICSSCSEFTTPSLAIEEIYDIERSRKAFLIRKKANERNENSAIDTNYTQEQVIDVEDSVQGLSLLLQEITDESMNLTKAISEPGAGAGTGSRTWDSSIAMSMYFAAHPELMVENVVEIGSGVGLGGILSFLFRSLSSSAAPFHSMTLTDYNDQVLRHCKENVSKFFESRPSFSSVNVAKLDWYDFLKGTGPSLHHAEKYDTVIACDCAYLYPDIVALIGTMKGLLKRKKTSRVHIFGPSNRGGLQELLSKLQEEKSFNVKVEYINMVRYRLGVPSGEDCVELLDPLQAITASSFKSSEFKYYSKYDSVFLHVTCSLRFDCETTFPPEEFSTWDID